MMQNTLNIAIRPVILGLVSSMAGLACPILHADTLVTSRPDSANNSQLMVTNTSQTSLPPAQLGISPATVKQTLLLSKGYLDVSVTLYNYRDKPKTMALTLVDTDQFFRPIAASDQTLKTWTIMNPSRFSVAPNSQQTVRLSVRPPPTFVQQTHYAMLVIEQQTSQAPVYDPVGKGVKMDLGTRYGLPFVIDVK